MRPLASLLARAPLPRRTYGPAAVLVASAARTTSGNGSGLLLPQFGATVAVQVKTTAATGTTPSMVLSLQWSEDGTDWYTADPAEPFTAITTTGNAVRTFARKGRFCRLAWAITGTTPSFTFSAGAYLVGA